MTTIAAFISSMEKKIISVFKDILLVCDETCLRRAGASKEWSGTKSDFLKKKEKIEKTVKHMMSQHKEKDKEEINKSDDDRDKHIRKLKNKIEKITKWINENEDKPGSRGNIIKSNITDNVGA